MALRIFEGVFKLGLFANLICWIVYLGLKILNNPMGDYTSGMGIDTLIVLVVIVVLIIDAFLLVPYLIIRRKRKKKGLPSPFDRFSKWVGKHKVLFIIGIAVAVIILFYVVVCSIQSKLLFYPNDYLKPRALTIEGVEAVSLDDGRFSGLIKKTGSDRLIVFFYGNAQSSGSAMCSFHDEIMDETYSDFDILIMDYPGYGESTGEPSGAGMYELADAVGKYVAGLDYREKTAAGYSVGTGAAVYAAAGYDWDKLILFAPYDSMLHVFNTFFPAFEGPMKGLMTNQLPSEKYAPDVTEDVLIICSEADTVVRSKLSEKLRDCFTANVEFHKLKDIPHSDIFCVEEVCKIVREFLK